MTALPPGGEPRTRAGGATASAAWAAAYLVLCGALHFLVARVPQDADTAYHVAVGRLIAEHGILRSFPWTPFSWLAEHYADKELAFHLLLAPLAGLDWITASALVGTLAGATLLLALRAVLRREGVPWAGLWALLPLLASSAFVFRFSLVRPHLFSIALALAVAWAAARGRLVLLGLLAAAYPWFYVAWQMPLVLVAAAEGARLLSGERVGWRPAAVAAAGIAAGILLHPNGWNLVRFNAIVLWDVLVQSAWGGRPGLELGDEFRPFTLREWGLLLAVPAALAAASLALAWRARRRDTLPLAFALAAAAFAALTLRTARFAEYLVPFGAAAFALALHASRPRRPALALAATLAVALAYSGRETAGLLERLRGWPDPLPAEDAARLAERIPPGAQVFTCDWGLTGRLMLALPERRFVVALDPTLFALNDPELYDLWYRFPREAPAGLAAAIRERFGAHHVACFWDDRFRPFFERIISEPGVTTILFSDRWNAYELREP